MSKEVVVGRPPLPIGTCGKITLAPQAGGSVQARELVRDYDGRVRLVAKQVVMAGREQLTRGWWSLQ